MILSDYSLSDYLF